MAKQANVNLSPATGAVSIFELMTFLELHSWVVLQESDGTTYEADVPANGHVITSGASGAGGLGNSNAWFRIREPNANVNPLTGGIAREWTFQRDTINNTDWRVKVSALDGFIGGTPGITQTPSAGDEGVLFGSGTDAAPTHVTLFPGDGTYRWHIVLMDVAEGGVYPFWAYTADNGTGLCKTLICTESFLAGSYPPLVGTRAAPVTGEPDPCIYACAYSTIAGRRFTMGSGSQTWQDRTDPPGRGWFAMNGSNGNVEAFVPWQLSSIAYSPSLADIGAPAYSPGSDGFGINALDGTDQLFPSLVGRPAGYGSSILAKGMTGHIRISGVDRSYPDTVTIGGVTWAYTTQNNAGSILLPFADGGAPL